MLPTTPNNFWELHICADATQKHIPINAILELTPLCNMNCDMCFVRLKPEEQETIGRLRTLEEWKSVSEEMQAAGTLFVLLTGGEPLLYPGFRELYLYLRQLGMIVTINTNGTLLDEEWADFFAAHKPRRINITVYGKDSDTYGSLCHYPDGYEKAVRAIRLLRERGVDVKMNGSITPSNAEDGDELIRLAQELKVPWKIDTYMYPASRERAGKFNQDSRLSPELAAKARVHFMEQETDHFLETAKQLIDKVKNTRPGAEGPMPMPCRAGRSSFMINWQGKMRPCVMVTHPEIPVFPQDFTSAWKQLVEETSQIRLSSKCSACRNRKLCQTCAACALLETGSYSGTPEYMCRYTEETLRLLEGYAE